MLAIYTIRWRHQNCIHFHEAHSSFVFFNLFYCNLILKLHRKITEYSEHPDARVAWC
jgi:hypothetical protein